jgi:Zn-finger nucleic acid-binding protein
MTQVNRQGVELDICPSCRGVWLDRGELEKLLEPLRSEAPRNEAPRDDFYRRDHGYRDDHDDHHRHGHDDHHGHGDYRGQGRRRSILDIFD